MRNGLYVHSHNHHSPISMSVSSIGNFGRLLRAMKRAIRNLGKQRRSKVGGKRGRRKGGRGGDDNFLEPIVKRKRAKVKSELILHNSYYNLSWAVIFLIFVTVRLLNINKTFLKKMKTICKFSWLMPRWQVSWWIGKAINRHESVENSNSINGRVDSESHSEMLNFSFQIRCILLSTYKMLTTASPV